MGVESVITGLFGLAGAGISAASSAHAQSAQASAQANLNKKTMEFNRKEAEKARQFTANQAVLDRNFNKAEALAARSFTAAQAKQMMDFNAKESQLGRTFNAQQSLLARQFEERMSSSAHQREVQDLRAAGLNPILSATGGNGASSPVAPVLASPTASASLGSSAQASHSGSGSVAASVGAMQALKKGNFIGEFMSSALSLVKANAELKHAEASDKQADAAKKNAETNEYSARWDAYIKNEGLGISRQKAAAEIDKLEADIELMFERLDIEKSVANATIEEKLAAAEKFKSGVLVDNQQAALLNLNREDLEGRLMYGNLLMQYLPRGLRNEVMNHFIEYIKDNKDVIYDFADSVKKNEFKSVDVPNLTVCANSVQNWLKEKGFIPTVKKLSWDEATKNLIGG